MKTRGKVGVLIEEHFDATEHRRFNAYFPERGYEVEYLSHLWGQPALRFGSTPEGGVVEEEVTVTAEVAAADPAAYSGIIAIGAHAMDRLRHEPTVRAGRRNEAPAVAFLRRAAAVTSLPVGAICHSQWLFCAAPELLRGQRVTCAHNILCDVENAGGEIVYEGDRTADLVIDGSLVTARHPEVVDRFMAAFADAMDICARG
ncbi:DJ-1/PfpI family protein [Sorangium sp. So ce1036]|uniref:DJ-1/PfpI family protein n=1 Tax=Sorangium sp. So ce1036 TaxID=3133328 RepID=UPI003F00833E